MYKTYDPQIKVIFGPMAKLWTKLGEEYNEC